MRLYSLIYPRLELGLGRLPHPFLTLTLTLTLDYHNDHDVLGLDIFVEIVGFNANIIINRIDMIIYIIYIYINATIIINVNATTFVNLQWLLCLRKHEVPREN